MAAACENGNRTLQNRRAANSMKEEEGRDKEGLQVQLQFSTLRR
jgi:hypothetical protein